MCCVCVCVPSASCAAVLSHVDTADKHRRSTLRHTRAAYTHICSRRMSSTTPATARQRRRRQHHHRRCRVVAGAVALCLRVVCRRTCGAATAATSQPHQQRGGRGVDKHDVIKRSLDVGCMTPCYELLKLCKIESTRHSSHLLATGASGAVYLALCSLHA